MELLLSTTLIIFVIISCNLQESRIENPESENNSSEQEIKNLPENKVTVIIYDGCEYIIYKEDKDTNASYRFMPYKGNCSNPIYYRFRTE